MKNINRRTALTVGLTVAAMPLIAGSAGAVPKAYGPDEGKELSPGVRLIELGHPHSIKSLRHRALQNRCEE